MVLNETLISFKSKFFSDPENPIVKISGMNMLTADRPIDSPRYTTFQGINETPIKFIYPNIFKVETYNLASTSLQLKTRSEIRLSIENYLKNKVNEYNTLLTNERTQALQKNPDLIQNANIAFKNNPHMMRLTSVDPLSTPLLTTEIRGYKLFSYEEMLQAI